MKFAVLVVLIMAESTFSASVSKRAEIVEIRDALNKILAENDLEAQKRNSGDVICGFHACTEDMAGCTMYVDENGCKYCECSEEELESDEELEKPEEGELTECQAERKEAQAVGDSVQDGPFVPECDEDGSYSSEQCYWDTCFCVLNPHGEKVAGTEVKIEDRHLLDCDNEQEKLPPKEPVPMKNADVEFVRREVEGDVRELLSEEDK